MEDAVAVEIRTAHAHATNAETVIGADALAIPTSISVPFEIELSWESTRAKG
jgi:hypothetical protein